MIVHIGRGVTSDFLWCSDHSHNRVNCGVVYMGDGIGDDVVWHHSLTSVKCTTVENFNRSKKEPQSSEQRITSSFMRNTNTIIYNFTSLSIRRVHPLSSLLRSSHALQYPFGLSDPHSYITELCQTNGETINTGTQIPKNPRKEIDHLFSSNRVKKES